MRSTQGAAHRTRSSLPRDHRRANRRPEVCRGIILFKTKSALNRFKKNRLELSARRLPSGRPRSRGQGQVRGQHGDRSPSDSRPHGRSEYRRPEAQVLAPEGVTVMDGDCGSCVCGAVAFRIEGPFRGFQYCHCSRCRKKTGSSHVANIFVPVGQFHWERGEDKVRRFELPRREVLVHGFLCRLWLGDALANEEWQGHGRGAGALDGDRESNPSSACTTTRGPPGTYTSPISKCTGQSLRPQLPSQPGAEWRCTDDVCVRNGSGCCSLRSVAVHRRGLPLRPRGHRMLRGVLRIPELRACGQPNDQRQLHRRNARLVLLRDRECL